MWLLVILLYYHCLPAAAAQKYLYFYLGYCYTKSLFSTRACPSISFLSCLLDYSSNLHVLNFSPTVFSPPSCLSVQMDVAFILDESGSISMEAFRNMTFFVGNVINDYTLGPNNIQVGVITYSNDPDLAIRLGSVTNSRDLRRDLGSLIPPFGGGTRTDLALQLAQTELTGPRSRFNAAKLAILLTDGMSTERALTSRAAASLRNRGVEVFVVGIGAGVDVSELNDIATDLDSDHVLLTDTFEMSELNMLTTTLSNRTCNGKQLYLSIVHRSLLLWIGKFQLYG